MMKSFEVNNDGTVTLKYEDEDVIVKKSDFDRAFGTMVNYPKEDIKRDFAIN